MSCSMKIVSPFRFLVACHSALVAAALLFLSANAAFPQGMLTPPGPPGATFKTLQQIEPRIDLQNAPALAVDTTNGNYGYIINQAGSYYLTGNLASTRPNALLIQVEGVTLDLNGFQISPGTGSTGFVGIDIAPASHRAVIRNGSVKGFTYGIVATGTTRGYLFRDLSVSECTNTGITTGAGAVLDSCRAHNNSGTAGISTGNGAVLTNCTAANNPATYGIYASPGTSLTNCTATANTGTYAIYAGDGALLTNCTAYSNTVNYGVSVGFGSSLNNCGVYGNTKDNLSGSYGIVAGHGSSLTNCSVSNNTVDYAISVHEGSSLTNCSATYNTGQAAIRSLAHSSLTGCTASYNTATYAFQTDSASVTNCTAGGNTAIGFFGDGSTLSGCLANNNTGIGMIGTDISNCSARMNGSDGIQLTGGTATHSSAISNGTGTTGSGIVGSQGASIINCMAQSNRKDGINVASDCVVRGNTGNLNGQGVADGGGIHATGRANRIEENNTSTNDIGIKVDLDGNFIVKNSSRGNPIAYSFAAGNSVGDQINVWNGGAGAIIVSSNPWANFLY
jgi:hypothetical protein